MAELESIVLSVPCAAPTMGAEADRQDRMDMGEKGASKAISLVICTHNRSNGLRATLESLKSMRVSGKDNGNPLL